MLIQSHSVCSSSVEPWEDSRCPPKTLYLSSAEQGSRNITKGSPECKDKEGSHTNYCHRQNRLDLRKHLCCSFFLSEDSLCSSFHWKDLSHGRQSSISFSSVSLSHEPQLFMNCSSVCLFHWISPPGCSSAGLLWGHKLSWAANARCGHWCIFYCHLLEVGQLSLTGQPVKTRWGSFLKLFHNPSSLRGDILC